MSRTRPAPEPRPAVLAPEVIAAFHRDGYVHVPGFIPDPERLCAWVAEIEAWPETPGRWMKYFEKSLLDGSRILNRVENFLPYHPGLDALAQGPLTEAASLLFGEPAVLFKDKINLKLPGGDGFKAHQDMAARWDRWGSLHITAMVAVDPADAENGPLEFVPGRHREGLLGPMDQPLADDAFPPGSYRPLFAAPGDLVLFDSYAPHRSGPNRSPRSRRLLYLTWNRASEGDHRDRYYREKRRSYPPDCEREPGKEYVFKV